MGTAKNGDLFLDAAEEAAIEKRQHEHEQLKRMLAVQVGSNLAKARRYAMKTQTQVMEDVFALVGQKNRISEIENGKMPDIDLLQRLCHYYGVSADWVLGFTAEPDVDHNAARSGILYSRMLEVLIPTMNEIALNLSHIGSKAIAAMPNSESLDLLDAAKKLIDSQVDLGLNSELATLMHAVQALEVKMARKNMENIKHLDDLANPENILYSQVLAKYVFQHPNSVVAGLPEQEHEG